MKLLKLLLFVMITGSSFAQFIPKSVNAISFKINAVMLTGKDEKSKDTIIDMTSTFKYGSILVFRDSARKELIGIDKGAGDENLVFIGYIKKIRKTGSFRKIPGKLYKFKDDYKEYENVDIIFDTNFDEMDVNCEPSYIFILYFIDDGVSMIFFVNLVDTFPTTKIKL